MYDAETHTVNHHLSAKRFFATVQNKLHWAIHGQTAAEVVYHRIVQDRLFESDFDRLVQQAGLGASSVDDGV